MPVSPRGALPVDDKQLRDLMDYLDQSSFSEFELERDGFKLRLVKAVRAEPQAVPEPAAVVSPAPGPVPAASASAPEAAENGLEDLPSPMVGTFYRAPNPNADPFVDVGDVVEPGQVIGIVEAMKLMNEIESDRRGEIVEIPVANGQPVEYGETIFRIRPLD
jgi:acetyl-CoA carboxylase biotin carboxyl carrier protein